LILFPELSEAADRIMVEPSLLRERSYLRSRAPGAAVEVLPLDPRAPDIARALATAKKREATVFFCYDGHLQPGNKRLLEALQRTGRPLALVLMRDPYDQEWAAPSTTVVTAFGYRERQVRACLERIFSAL
jgi:beta-N-acetylhexosaminidase